MVVSVVLLVLAAGFMTAFLAGQSAYLSADADIQAQEQGRKALDRMVRELREANPVNVTVTGTQQLDFQIALGYNLTSPPGCAAPPYANNVCWGARDQNGTLQPGWGVRYRVQAVAGRTQLIREVVNPAGAAGAPQEQSQVLAILINGAPVAVDLNDTSFSAPSGTGIVTITLEVQNPSNLLPGGLRSFGSVTSQVRLRNP